MQEQTKLFGTDHLYAADTFIEMIPPRGDAKYLTDMSRAILSGMMIGLTALRANEVMPASEARKAPWVSSYAPIRIPKLN